METILIGALSAFLKSPTLIGALVLVAGGVTYGVIKIAIAAGRIADSGRDLVAAVRELGTKLDEKATTASVVAVDRRVDELATKLTTAIGADGEHTRQVLEDRRLSELTAATVRTERAAEEAVRIVVEAAEPEAAPPPARRQRTGSHPIITAR